MSTTTGNDSIRKINGPRDNSYGILQMQGEKKRWSLMHDPVQCTRKLHIRENCSSLYLFFSWSFFFILFLLKIAFDRARTTILPSSINSTFRWICQGVLMWSLACMYTAQSSKLRWYSLYHYTYLEWNHNHCNDHHRPRNHQSERKMITRE